MRSFLPARIARSSAVSLMALAMLASAVPPHHAAHSDVSHGPTEAHTAGFEMQTLWMLLVSGWNALRGAREICQDCNLPVDDGCRCVCYSGGYDPDDPACQ